VRDSLSAAIATIGAPAFAQLYRLDRAMRRKLTPAGWLVFSTLVAAAIFGLNTQETFIYQVFALCVGLLAVAAAASWKLGLRARLSRALPQVATAGAEFTYAVSVTNLGANDLSGLEIEETLTAERPARAEFARYKVREDRSRNIFDRLVGYPRWVSLMRWKTGARVERARLSLAGSSLDHGALPAQATWTATLRCVPLRRGELRFDALTISRDEPLGLMRALWKHRLTQTLLVMPRTYPVAPIDLPGSRRLQPGGVAFAGRVGDAEEFVSLRDYRAGDSPRRIHWKAWARTGRLVVKEYQDEFFVRHALLLDTFPSGDATHFEAAVSLAASLAIMPRSGESLLDLMFVEDRAYTLTRGRALGAATDLLRVLATVTPSRGTFATLAEAALLNARRISGGICVFLAWDAPRRELVAELRGRGIALRVWVVADDADPSLADPGPMAADRRNFRVVNPANIAAELLKP
jgi:uncharacterized protein (DUF58 family)